MKSDVEKLSDTRVKLSVEIPFADLADALSDAYQRISQQVQIPGFRRGKVPQQIIDQRIGRGAVLEDVVNSAVPEAYEEAIREAEIVPLGQPQVEVTEIEDGEKIAFVAEVDIRPDFELPEYKGLQVEVDPLEVTDENIAEELDNLRSRFGSFNEVDRAAAEGDVLLIDIAGEYEGEQIDDLSAQAMSYEIGKDGVLPGLDDAVTGKSAGDDSEFTFTPEFGEYEGKPLAVKVAVKAVREKVLPPLDDELAMMASEFDTLDELRGGLQEQLQRSLLADRGAAARTKLQEDLLAAFEVPVPEGIVQAEVDSHFEDHDDHPGGDDENHRAEVEANTREALKMQFLMDGIADEEDLAVGEAELSQWLVMQAPRYGMNPDQLAQALVEAGQVPMAVAEVRRSKAMALVLQEANIVDTNGEKIDISQLDPRSADDEADDEVAAEIDDEAAADAEDEDN